MRVIPVIDLMHDQVVRARKGDRASYQPMETPLSPTSDAVDVVRGLLTVYPFRTIYVADLDAIQSHGDNVETLRRIRDAFPALQIWVDNGAAASAAIEALIGADLGQPVIGSESQRDSKLIAHHKGSRRVVLSLDFRDDIFQGPQEILAEPALWPQRVIVMTLARVGSGAGPDLGAPCLDPVKRPLARDLRRGRRPQRGRSPHAQTGRRGRRANRNRAARSADCRS